MHRNTRRTAPVAAVTVFLAALTLAGCGGDDTGSTAAKPKSSTVSKEDEFKTNYDAAFLDSWSDAAKRPTDEEVQAYPPQWCAGLEDGHSVDWLFNDGGLYPIGDTWGTTQADAHKLLVMAVDIYCPGMKPQVTEELRGTGAY